MKIEELEKGLGLEEGAKTYKGDCHDCGKHVEVSATATEEGETTISGGALYKIKQGYHEELFFKCDDCYKRDKTLHNFRECERFSRVVGYLRPVNQWNKGKQEEFKHRVLFKNLEGD